MNRRSPWILVALVLCAFALRVYRLDFVSLRGDESFTVLFVAEPVPQLLEGIRNVEPNPPLYYFLLRGAMSLLGQNGFSMRYVSAFFGVLAIPLLYQLGRALMPASRLGETAALLAALLLTINPYQIWHSQDVRNYTLWPALSLASLCFMLRALRENRRSFWIGYVVMTLLSLYTHYYDVLVLLFENAFVFLCHRRDRPLIKRWLIAQAILAILYLPWPLFGSSRPFSYEDVTASVPGILGIVAQSLSVFTVGQTVPQILATVLLPAWLLLLVLGLGSAFHQDRHIFAFLLLYLAIPTLCIFLLAQWRPLFRERYLNVIAPGYYLTFALGLAALIRPGGHTGSPLLRWGRALTAVGLGLLVIPAGFSLGHYYFDPQYAKSANWRGLAAYLEAQAGPDDVIVQNYPDPSLAYYYHGPSEHVVLPHRSAVDQVGDLPVKRVATGKALQQLLAEHRLLWLLPYKSEWDPQGFVESWLNRRARKVHEEQVEAFRVVAYERMETASPSIQYPSVSRLGEAVELLGYDLATDSRPTCRLQEAGDARPEPLILGDRSCLLHLTLYWHVLAPVDTAYTVFTHLLGPDGQIQAQQDNQPQGGGFPTLEWLPGDVIPDPYTLAFPPDAPPGEYALEVGMYRPETMERLPADDANGQQWPGDAIRVALSIQLAP